MTLSFRSSCCSISNLPRVGGFEVLASIKSLQATRHIPVVVLTSSESPATTIIRSYRLGANCYLTKPSASALTVKWPSDCMSSGLSWRSCRHRGMKGRRRGRRSNSQMTAVAPDVGR